MSSDIPKAREILKDALRETTLRKAKRRISKALALMTRDSATKRARPRSARITPALKQRIKAFYAGHRRMANRDIGRIFGVDGGRVSEVLRGKR